MSVVTTTVSPSVRITPFTGLSETVRERSGIARAEVVYSAYGTWDAPGAGNERGLIFSWDLDPDYGHVLMDCSAAFILASDSLRMEAAGFMEIGTDLGPGATQKERQYYGLTSYASRNESGGHSTGIGSITANKFNTIYPGGTDVGVMTFGMPIKPTALLYPFPGVSSIEIATMFGEPDTNRPSTGYRFYCRFLQYDITQGYHYAVQSPALTR